MSALTSPPILPRPPADSCTGRVAGARLFSDRAKPAVAGTESQLLALIRHVDRRRVAPHLCLLRVRPREAGCRAGGLPRVAARRRRPGPAADGSSRMVRSVRLLRRHRIDVLQAYFPDSSYFGLPAARLAGVPHRLRTRNNLGHWLTPGHRRLGRALNALTTATLTNCDAARQALLAAEGPGACGVGPRAGERRRPGPIPGPTPDRRNAARKRRASGRWRTCGRSKAWTCWSRRRAAAGRVPAAGGLPRRRRGRPACRAGSGDRAARPGRAVLTPGRVRRRAALPCRPRRGRAPSRAEGMSNALLGDMAAGRPIVATAVGGNPELVEHGVHALLVPPDDAGALARAIDRLLKERPLARRLPRRQGCGPASGFASARRWCVGSRTSTRSYRGSSGR